MRLLGGSPHREDDGGSGDPRASTLPLHPAAYHNSCTSFSRSARESPGWFCRGNDDVLPCPSSGDPRFARMTEERATLARPRYRRTPLRTTTLARHSEPAPAGEESPGWFHQGNDNGSENIARHSCALHGNPPPMVCTGSDNALLCPSAGDPRFARMTEKIHGSPASTFPHPQRVSCKGAMFKISYFSIHKKDINGC